MSEPSGKRAIPPKCQNIIQNVNESTLVDARKQGAEPMEKAEVIERLKGFGEVEEIRDCGGMLLVVTSDELSQKAAQSVGAYAHWMWGQRGLLALDNSSILWSRRDTDVSELAQEPTEPLPDRIRRIWREEGGPEVVDVVDDGRGFWSVHCKCQWAAYHSMVVRVVDENGMRDPIREMIARYAEYFIRHHWAAGGGPELEAVKVYRVANELCATIKCHNALKPMDFTPEWQVGIYVRNWDSDGLRRLASDMSGASEAAHDLAGRSEADTQYTIRASRAVDFVDPRMCKVPGESLSISFGDKHDESQDLMAALMAGKRPHGDTWSFWSCGPMPLNEDGSRVATVNGWGYRAPCRCYTCIQCDGGPRTEHSAQVKRDYGVKVSRAVAIGCQTWGLLMARGE